ncbi:MAG: PAS domain-containing protein [Silvibacterium sp.]
MLTKHRYFLRALPRPLRWLLGLVPAAVAIGLFVIVPVNYRTPYLIAYPFVVLSAWYLGVGGGAVCALASGLSIEYLVYYSRVLSHASVPEFSFLRLVVFVAGSVLVGGLMRQVSTLTYRTETDDLRRQLDKLAADRRLSKERSAAALAMRERETRLQMALDGGHVGLWDNDLEHGRVIWSDEHYRIVGFEPGSVDPGYETMRTAIHPEDRDAMDALFQETMVTGRPFCCEYRVVWPDGTTRWVEAQAKYEMNEQGKAVRMLGVMMDITHRKQAEAALLRTEKLAVTGRLAASIAHEINNPLEAVANLLYLIARADDLGTARQQAQQALAETMRVARIAQQTLKFHRQSEAARTTRMSEVIDDVLELFQGRLAESNLIVDRRYDDDPAVECLAGDLRQVFANLIANALDAMSHGGRLVLRLRRSRDWRSRRSLGIRITFLDTGCGMDIQTRHRIYEPFFTTKKESGTGLGLWVTAEIIDRQLGDLRVWSSRIPGRSGTAFSLFIPLRGVSLGTPPAIPEETTLQAT